MSFASPSSGDPLADRRFDWAAASAREGDHEGAADLFAQVVARVPAFAPGWLGLGEALVRLGREADARVAFMQVAALDRDDRLGARVALAALGDAAPATMHPAFVRGLFDHYADTFDAHLTGTLRYDAPQKLVRALESTCADAGRAFRFGRALDLGCGTGLFGAALGGRAEALIGVDLAPRMLAKAARGGLYAALREGDLLDFLAAEPAASADLVVAADVFVYLGSLDAVLAQCARVLAPGGLIAFTTQRGDGDGFALGPDRRFRHSRAYVQAAMARAGLSLLVLDDVSTREDAGVPLPGLLTVGRCLGLSSSGLTR